MDTHFSKVIATESKPKNKYEQRLPRRRGQIKGRIFKGLALTIGSLVGCGCGGGKEAETGGLLSSNTATPATTPTDDSPDARLATPF